MRLIDKLVWEKAVDATNRKHSIRNLDKLKIGRGRENIEAKFMSLAPFRRFLNKQARGIISFHARPRAHVRMTTPRYNMAVTQTRTSLGLEFLVGSEA